nr:unnamed protein product [Haemonchus contortus]
MKRRRCARAAIGNIKEAAHLVSDKKHELTSRLHGIASTLLRIRDVSGEQDANANVGSRTKRSRADAAEDQPRKTVKSQPPQRRHALNFQHP